MVLEGIELVEFDNVFVERFRRTLKYAEVYRREYTGIAYARKHIADYIETYNTRRLPPSLNDRTPARVQAEIQVHKAA
jgi:putative transposase